jgi:hypothetical protein
MAVLPADVESRKKTLIEVTQLILLVRCPGATILNDRPITPADAPYKPIECATYAPDN